MDALQYVERQHQATRAALVRLTGAAPDERRALWTALRSEVAQHEQVEEHALYEPLARAGTSDPVLSEWVTDRHRDEAREIEALMLEVDDLDPEDQRWLVTVRQIQAALEHHMRQEEQTVFPRIGRIWDRRRLEAVGRACGQARRSEPAARSMSGKGASDGPS